MKRTPEPERIIPANEAAERALLGCILMDNAMLAQSAIVAPQDFLLASHQVIYQAMLDMRDEGQGIDLVTLPEHLGHEATMQAGGYAYLCSLTEGVVRHSRSVRDYVRIIKGKALARRLIAACMTAVEAAYTGNPGMAIIQLLRDNLDEIEREAKKK